MWAWVVCGEWVGVRWAARLGMCQYCPSHMQLTSTLSILFYSLTLCRKLFRGVMDGCPDSMKVEMSRAVAESEAELMLGGDMEEGVAARGRGG